MPKRKNPEWRLQRIHELLVARSGSQSVVKSAYLCDVLDIGLRTLRKDMDQLRQLGAPLEYVAALYGWRYESKNDFVYNLPIALTSEDAVLLRVAFETLSKAGQLGGLEEAKSVFEKINKAVRKWNDRTATGKPIYFDPLPAYAGTRLLAFFLKSIEEHRRVVLKYKPYHSGGVREVLFDPWFLRNYDRRWYAGGYSHDPEEGFVRVFPLERIVGEPVVQGYCHDKPRDFDASEYWSNIYGITVPKEGRVERVVLEWYAIQKLYFLDTPFFEPYVVLEDAPDRLRVAMRVIPNIDLIRKIGSYGGEVRVLEPEWLVEKMKGFHLEGVGRYE
jgi:predicted DNA-binding transcriptional regulator YafY